MPYHKLEVQSQADFVEQIKDILDNEGWAVIENQGSSGGYIYSKGGNHFLISVGTRNNSAEVIQILIGSGVDNGILEGQFPAQYAGGDTPFGLYDSDISGSFENNKMPTFLSLSWPVTAHVFLSNSPFELGIVFEALEDGEYTVYQHLTVAEADRQTKKGLIATGAACYRHSGNLGIWEGNFGYHTNRLTSTNSTTWYLGLTSSSSLKYMCAPFQSFITSIRNVNDDYAISRVSDRISGFCMPFMTRVVDNIFHNMPVLMPLVVAINGNSTDVTVKIDILKDYKSMKVTCIDVISDGEIIDIGNQKWMVFPMYRRGPYTGTGSYEHSYGWGIAYKYDGPDPEE